VELCEKFFTNSGICPWGASCRYRHVLITDDEKKRYPAFANGAPAPDAAVAAAPSPVAAAPAATEVAAPPAEVTAASAAVAAPAEP
jgi:hypothetical protein